MSDDPTITCPPGSHPGPGTQTAPADPLTASGGETPFDHPGGFASEAAGGLLAGRYRLREPLGEGGMGSVWLADQLEPVRREVAVKVIKRGLDSARVLARFEAERQALALMDHPHIAKVLDGGATAAGHPFFVMEVVRGDTLVAFCDARRLGVRERLDLFTYICAAVQHAHQKGVIHRDLKPSNILVEEVDGRPVPKVIDFGLAKAVGAEPLADRTATTVIGTVLGTPPYMAPEQAAPGAVDVDTRADVYALGAVLYELLTGTTPIAKERFARLPLDEVMRLVREEEPPTPSRRLSDTESDERAEPAASVVAPRVRHSHDLDWVVMKAIAKERERRYESASGLAADVRRYLADEPVQARPPTAGYKLRKFVRRNKVQVVAGSLVLLALMAGAIGTALGLVEAWRQRDDANDARGREAAQRVEAEKQAADARTQRDRAVTAEGQATERLAQAVAEKGRADREAAAAKEAEANTAAFADFILGRLLYVARPAGILGGLGVDVTVARAIEVAEKDLDRQFAGQPVAEAATRLAIGTTWRHLSRYADAERHLSTAARLYRKHAPDDPLRYECENELAHVWVDRGRYADAIKLLEPTLAAQKRLKGDDHRDTLDTARNLALAFTYGGRSDEAVALYERLRKIDPENALPHDRWKLVITQDLAATHLIRGDAAAAIPLFEEVCDGLTALPGDNRAILLEVQVNLSAAYLTADRIADAIALGEKIRQPLAEAFGPRNSEVLRLLNNLAGAYWKAGRLDMSVPLFEEAARLTEEVNGPTHRLTIAAVANLGINYCDAGRPADGVLLLERAYRNARKHPTLSWVGHELIHSYRANGDDKKAVAVVREQLADARGRLKVDSAELGGELANAGYELLTIGTADEAAAVLRDCLAIREKLAPDAWTTFNVRSMLGGALARQGKHAEAEPLLVSGLEGLVARRDLIPANGRANLPEAGRRVIDLYVAWGKPDKAAEWRAKAPRETLPPPRATK